MTGRQEEFKQRAGFTIVELLIVVVVIAILAAITVVVYNGITDQAKEAALKSDLTTAAKKLNLEKVETGSFPDTYSATGLTYSGGGNAFCVTGSASGKNFRVKETGAVEEGNCSLPIATTMQTFTSAHCSALATFTGSNSSAVVSLTDSRGGTTRTYEVAKLADGKCWMLTILKLGSTAGPLVLTPADSDVSSNFTLPQLRIGEGENAEYDTPRAYGPVPGDTGSGAANYGYLYNWSAATAGATRTSNPVNSGNAQNSICAKGWQLPSGGAWNDPNNEFSQLNAKMAGLTGVTDAGYTSSNYSSATNAAHWSFTGPFKGVFAGRWWDNLGGQGTSGEVWSRSTSGPAYNSNYAQSAFFGANYVNPGNGMLRAYGFGVRCLID
ncbi:prepilin-type N-terminal cleavage/methylation domain-containing protein [Leucobacter sp. HNU]|uniref:prepilin-type N-terminal cleavage/methylation domain-containing protein n=1 Tax=Leucobacter sp. HNU TaxID=3236805 RepID=UPI003A803A62